MLPVPEEFLPIPNIRRCTVQLKPPRRPRKQRFCFLGRLPKAPPSPVAAWYSTMSSRQRRIKSANSLRCVDSTHCAVWASIPPLCKARNITDKGPQSPCPRFGIAL
ncbi:unnamed protein product, partial [Ectocarpus sp. 6 AP-2014]